jgi:coenzyme F420-reducing hydrogenase delta subunit
MLELMLLLNMTKAQAKRRMMECISKLNKILDSKWVIYDISASDARKIRDVRDDLVKQVRKLK